MMYISQIFLMLGLTLYLSGCGFSYRISRYPKAGNHSIVEGKWVELTLSVSNIEANVFGIDISLDSCIDSSTLNIDYMKIQCSSVNATSICKVFQILVRGDKQNVNNLTIGLCVYATVSGQINATNSQQYKIRVIENDTFDNSGNSSTIKPVPHKDCADASTHTGVIIAAGILGFSTMCLLVVSIILAICLCILHKPSTSKNKKPRNSSRRSSTVAPSEVE